MPAKKKTSKSLGKKLATKDGSHWDSVNNIYGAQAIINMVDGDFVAETMEVISTGILSYDIAAGGGLRRGVGHMMYGAYSSAKSSMVASICANVTQLRKENVFIVDLEGTNDSTFFKMKGVDLHKCFRSRPVGAEEALDLVTTAIDSDDYGLIVLDSIASMFSVEEGEKSFADGTRPSIPRNLARLRRAIESKQNSCIRRGVTPPTIILVGNVIIDQNDSYSPIKPSGGFQIRNYVGSMWYQEQGLKIWDGGTALKEADRDYVGKFIKYKNEKNKYGPQFERGTFGILSKGAFGHKNRSILHGEDIFRVGMATGVITQSGSTYVLPGAGRAIRGEQAVWEAIVGDDGIRMDTVTRIKEILDDTFGIVVAYDAEVLYDQIVENRSTAKDVEEKDKKPKNETVSISDMISGEPASTAAKKRAAKKTNATTKKTVSKKGRRRK